MSNGDSKKVMKNGLGTYSKFGFTFSPQPYQCRSPYKRSSHNNPPAVLKKLRNHQDGSQQHFSGNFKLLAKKVYS
jgi:hypothetical protein